MAQNDILEGQFVKVQRLFQVQKILWLVPVSSVKEDPPTENRLLSLTFRNECRISPFATANDVGVSASQSQGTRVAT